MFVVRLAAELHPHFRRDRALPFLVPLWSSAHARLSATLPILFPALEFSIIINLFVFPEQLSVLGGDCEYRNNIQIFTML